MTARSLIAAIVLTVVATLALEGIARAETWRGLTMALEARCSVYNRKRDYRS